MNRGSGTASPTRRKKVKKLTNRQKKNRRIVIGFMVILAVFLIWVSSCVARWANSKINIQEPTSSALNISPTENPDDIPDNGDDGFYVNSDIFIWNNQAFELFKGNTKNAISYASAINYCTRRMPEGIKVYSMVIPTHISMGLPKRLENTMKSTNQKTYIAEITNHYINTVIPVNIFNTLNKHKKEYIFFNTDHRWTTLGSYYAYEQFCRAANETAIPITDKPFREIHNFAGSLYGITKLETLKNNADTIRYYDISEKCDIRILKNNRGNYETVYSIYDESAKSGQMPYNLFLYGDNPITVIANREEKNGKKLLIVKNSYADCFVPFLIGHYDELHIIDFTVYEGNIPLYCRSQNITDMLIMSDIMTSVNTFQLEKLGDIF